MMLSAAPMVVAGVAVASTLVLIRIQKKRKDIS
jgi:hypothetical protein